MQPTAQQAAEKLTIRIRRCLQASRKWWLINHAFSRRSAECEFFRTSQAVGGVEQIGTSPAGAKESPTPVPLGTTENSPPVLLAGNPKQKQWRPVRTPEMRNCHERTGFTTTPPHLLHRPTTYSIMESTTLTTTDVASGK